MTGWVVEWRWRSLGVFLCLCICVPVYVLRGKTLEWNNLTTYIRNREEIQPHQEMLCSLNIKKVTDCWLTTTYCNVSIFFLPPHVDNSHSFYPFRLIDAHTTPRQTDNRPTLADATTSLSCIILGFYWENNPTHHRVPFVCLCVGESFVNSLPWFKANTYSFFHSLFI